MYLDRCVVCGDYVPEGRMVCPKCEMCDNKYKTIKNGTPEKKHKKTLRRFVKNKIFCDEDED